MKLSIIIPVYNEAGTISEIFERVRRMHLRGVEKEIIIVDDGSTDGTTDIITSLPKEGSKVVNVAHKKNRGKGAAVRTGLKAASGDILLIQDADLEYNPLDYPRLISPILAGRAQVVYGTRLADYPLILWGKNRTPMPFHLIGNKLLAFLTNILYQGKLTDMETCYKVITRAVLKNLKLRADRFDFEPEITAKILKAGYKIWEVPIKVQPRNYKEGKKIKWWDGLIALWTLLKYRFVD